MSILTVALGPRQERILNRKWEGTRRIAYDAEEDEDERLARIDPTLKAQPDLTRLIKSTEALARSTPRLKDNRRPTDDRIQTKLSHSRSLKLRNSTGPSKRPQTPARSATSTENTKNKSLDDAAELPKEEWILEEFDYSSRWWHGYYGRWVMLAERNWQFSHARVQPEGSLGYVPPIVRKPKATFTSLPPEIRNAVYEYVIPERNLLITRTHPNKEARTQTKCWSEDNVVASRQRSRLTHEPEWTYTSEELLTAINLLLTCKKVKGEVETFLYSRILFCFHSLKSLRRFLHTASASGIQSMRKIFIAQDGYGNSFLTADQRFRGRYYKSWEKVCTLVGQMAPNLKHIKLKVYDREWPSELSGKDYAPIWKTAILKTAPVLVPRVEVRIHHQMIDHNKEVLSDLARRVEDSMMTQEGRDDRDRLETVRVMAEIDARKAAKEERERKKRVRLNAPPPRTELVISMDDIQKQANNTQTVKKLRSKGLERYDRTAPNVYSLQPEQDV